MNPVHFTGWEVLEMAVKIEENGYQYYADASRAARNKPLKDLFKLLSSEEAGHIKVFTDLKKLVPEETAAAAFDPYMTEASEYLKAMADKAVFTESNEGKKLARITQDERQALDAAIGMEKDSILFYYEIAKMMRERDRNVLDSLIGQEKEHLKKLTAMQRELYG